MSSTSEITDEDRKLLLGFREYLAQDLLDNHFEYIADFFVEMNIGKDDLDEFRRVKQILVDDLHNSVINIKHSK